MPDTTTDTHDVESQLWRQPDGSYCVTALWNGRAIFIGRSACNPGDAFRVQSCITSEQLGNPVNVTGTTCPVAAWGGHADVTIAADGSYEIDIDAETWPKGASRG